MTSDGLLEFSNCECFHDGLRRTRLDHDHLAEHLTLACLGGWLGAGDYPCDSWKDQFARLLHLRRNYLSQGVQYLSAFGLLQLRCSGKRISQLTLGQALGGLSFHCLRSHDESMRRL